MPRPGEPDGQVLTGPAAANAMVRFLGDRAQMGRVQPISQRESDPAIVRLLGLLLVDALQTIARGRSADGARETRAWVCERGSGVYSFERACEAFGLPPRALRRRLGLRAQVPRRRTSRGWIRRASSPAGC